MQILLGATRQKVCNCGCGELKASKSDFKRTFQGLRLRIWGLRFTQRAGLRISSVCPPTILTRESPNFPVMPMHTLRPPGHGPAAFPFSDISGVPRNRITGVDPKRNPQFEPL